MLDPGELHGNESPARRPRSYVIRPFQYKLIQGETMLVAFGQKKGKKDTHGVVDLLGARSHSDKADRTGRITHRFNAER